MSTQYNIMTYSQSYMAWLRDQRLMRSSSVAPREDAPEACNSFDHIFLVAISHGDCGGVKIHPKREAQAWARQARANGQTNWKSFLWSALK